MDAGDETEVDAGFFAEEWTLLTFDDVNRFRYLQFFVPNVTLERA